MRTSWTKESSFHKIKPLLIGLLRRKVYHRVCISVISSNEKNEPHLFPYSRVVVHFIACCGYNVDRWNFPPKDGVSRQKTRPNGVIPENRAASIFPGDSCQLRINNGYIGPKYVRNTNVQLATVYHSTHSSVPPCIEKYIQSTTRMLVSGRLLWWQDLWREYLELAGTSPLSFWCW